MSACWWAVSTAAGGIGTAKKRGQTNVRFEVCLSRRGIGPMRIALKHLTTQLVGDPDRLSRAQARDAVGPVRVFALADSLPIA